jgi:beta-barrel assembly-enhancing protease
MHFIKYLLACLTLTGALDVFAQDSTRYERLVSTGAIPRDFVTSSADKYKKEVSQYNKTNSSGKKDVKLKRRFALESNFVIDDLLQSGKVLFNDEVSLYLAEVLQQLEKTQPAAAKTPLKIYALRTSAVNAFATDRGEIFVTLGLLAQLENEAQLAYILAHELTHVEKKHGMSLFLKSERISRRDSDRSVLEHTVVSDKSLARCAFSKEHETEADQLGMQRFLKTGYRCATLPTVIDVLKYAYLPFDDLAFNRNLLQNDAYRLPEEYWLETVKAIRGPDEAEDEKNSTHPNLKTRREQLMEALKKTDDTGKSDYLVSEMRFKQVRNLARFELPMLYLHADNLSEALYTTGLLLEQHPNNLYLNKCLLKALYFSAKFKTDGDYKYKGDYENVEGESQQVFHLMEKIPGKEAVILALHTGWKLHLAHPEDAEIKQINQDLFFEMARKFDNLKDFQNTAPATASAKVDTTQRQNSKYDKIRKQKSKEGGADYWQYAFTEWLDSEDFKKGFEAGYERYLKEKKQNKYLESASGRKKLAKAERRARTKGLSLDIPKIAIVNPFYLKIDQRKDNSIQYADTETGQDHFRNLIRDIANEASLKIEVLDVCNLKDNQTETFNDIRFLNEWFSEQVNHYELSLVPGYDQERINKIAQKYGTDYFLWTGVISLREQHKYTALKIIGSLVLFFPITPLVAYYSLKPDYDMLHYSILYDVRTGKRQVLKFDTFDRRETDTVVKAHLYDTFLQIKRQ